MLRSMTAFASAEADTGHGTLAIELRSVNHRYLELGLRLPEELRSLEATVRERVAAKLSRGKVDLGVRYKPAVADASAITVDDALVTRLADTAQALAAKFPQLNVDFTSLLGWPGVMLDRDTDQESLREAALDVARYGAGRHGRDACSAKASVSAVSCASVWMRWSASSPTCVPTCRKYALRCARVSTRRLAELKTPLEPGRVEQEVVLQVQRIDVDEELDRLTAHIAEARRMLRLVRSGRPPPRLPDAGIQSRGEHARFEVRRSAHHAMPRSSSRC